MDNAPANRANLHSRLTTILFPPLHRRRPRHDNQLLDPLYQISHRSRPVKRVRRCPLVLLQRVKRRYPTYRPCPRAFHWRISLNSVILDWSSRSVSGWGSDSAYSKLSSSPLGREGIKRLRSTPSRCNVSWHNSCNSRASRPSCLCRLQLRAYPVAFQTPVRDRLTSSRIFSGKTSSLPAILQHQELHLALWVEMEPPVPSRRLVARAMQANSSSYRRWATRRASRRDYNSQTMRRTWPRKIPSPHKSGRPMQRPRAGFPMELEWKT